MTDTNVNKYAGGGKMWVPDRRNLSNAISNKNLFPWETVSMVSVAASGTAVCLYVISAISSHFGTSLGGTFPDGTSDLLIDFKRLPAQFFIVLAILGFVFTIAAVVFRMKLKKKKLIQPQLFATIKMMIKIVAAPIIAVILIGASSLLIPHDNTVYKDKAITAVEDWTSKRNIDISHAEAVKLVNFAWEQKSNGDERFPHDSKAYVLPLKANNKTIDFVVYKIRENHIVFSVKK